MVWLTKSKFLSLGSGKRFLLLVSALVLTLWTCPGFAMASDLPTGGNIVAGYGSIATNDKTLTVTQDSHKLIADWTSFSIGEDNTVNFLQPGRDAAALNRVLGDQVSEIRGALNANGKVFLVNPNGIVFGATAQVNVGGLVASTLNISNDDFLAGNYRFEGDSANAIVNHGNINADGGTIALIAARIMNDGTLTANSGNVLLGAGSKVLLDLGGPVKIEVEESAIDALIEQGGAIKADSGYVYLTAKAAGDLASTVINHTGITEAQTLATGENGEIFLMGDPELGNISAAGTLDASAPHGDGGGSVWVSGGEVEIAGLLDVASAEGKGGLVVTEGDHITIAGSSQLNAKGATGGGQVLVGGDWQGGANKERRVFDNPNAIKQATTVTMEEGAVIDASATDNGDGGTVVLWSDINNASSITTVQGSIYAKGGTESGNGGLIETSGYNVDFIGSTISAAAANGTGGLWLIDPSDSTIDQAVANSYATTLNGGTSVENAVTGSITWNDSVTLSKTNGADATLTLKASDSITLGNDSSISSNSNKLNVVLWADSNSSGDGRITLNNGSAISTNGGGLWLGGSYGSNSSGTTSWTPYSGGSGITVGDGYATSTGGNYGIFLDRATINTAGGNINIYGFYNDEGTSTDSGLYVTASSMASAGGNITLEGVNARTTNGSDKATGLEIDGYGDGATSGTTISSEAGDIFLLGKLDSSGFFNEGSGLNLGTRFSWGTGSGATGDVSITSTSGNIAIEGNSQNVNSSRWVHGLVFEVQESGDDLLIQSGSGNITITGKAGGGTATAHGLSLQTKRADANTTIKIVSTGNGNITLDGDAGTSASNAGLSLLGQTNGGNGTIWLGYDGSNAYSGTVTLRADSFDLRNNLWVGADTGLGSVNILGAGLFAITSNAASFARTVTLGNSFDFGSSLTGFAVGKATNTADLTLNNQIETSGTFTATGGNITATNAANDFTGTVVVSGQDVSLVDVNALAMGASTVSGGLTLLTGGVITQSGALAVSGTTGITAGAGNNVTLNHTGNNFGGAVTVTSGADISLVDSNAMTVGAISSTGLIDIATLADDLTLTGAVETTNTTADAIKLNAGKSTAAGTETGGNIIVSGGSVSVGSGVRATLYSGSVSGSTGLTDLVGSGSGRFRYNSDEADSNFTTTLTAGVNAIYREQPTVTVTANNDSKTYDGLAYSSGNGVGYGGFVNGDTSDGLGGTLSYGGTSQGATNAGSYVITPSGLTSAGLHRRQSDHWQGQRHGHGQQRHRHLQRSCAAAKGPPTPAVMSSRRKA